MDDAVKRTIRDAAAKMRAEIETDYGRRVAAVKEFKELLGRTKLLSGGAFTPMDLCESIAIQKKIQNIMALNLPRFLGNYNCKRYFQEFKGTEQEFIEQHPELKGSSGHAGVDAAKFSTDLRSLLTAKGNAYAEAFDRVLAYTGAGVAISTGFLHLYDPTKYPLVNNAAKAGLQYYIGTQNRNTVRAFSQKEREILGISSPVSRRLESCLGWSHIIKQFTEIEGLEDFHKVDSLLWLTNKQRKSDIQGKRPDSVEGVQYWRVIEPFDTKDYSIWPGCREHGLISLGYHENPDAPDVRFMQNDIKIGDKVIAYLEKRRIGGIGTVTGEYEDYDVERPKDKDFFGGEFWRRRKVKWDYLPEKGNFWTLSWVPSGTRRTVYRMSEQEFHRILKDIGVSDVESEEKDYTFRGLTSDTFNILKELAKDTSYEAVKPLSDDIHKYVVHPLRDLFYDIAQDFDTGDMLNLETKKHVMSHLWKANPRLGAWPHVWGAFYQKNESRTESMQFFISLTADHLTYGIYPSDKNQEIRVRLENNYEKYGDQLQEYLPTDFYQRYFFYADSDTDRYRNKKMGKDYKDLLRYFKEDKMNIGCILTPDEVIGKGSSLVPEIRNAFEDLIPLYVCGITDDPIPMLESYYKTDYDRATDAPFVSEEYSLAQCMYDTGFDEITIATWIRAIERKGQVVFYGPPGTGKTYVAEKLAKHLVSEGDGFIEFVQFHPAYSYEDFMQGIRPKSTTGGRLDYPVVPGRFLDFIRKAQACKDYCVLIIDEINRANLARVFGELMYLLEYRDRKMHLAAGGTIKIPENVCIIGTMNTADRSIALVDHALRRRFAFLALYPQYDILRKYHADTDFPVENLIEVLEQLNKAIDDKHYSVGITFFLKHDLEDQIEDIWKMEIEPYLEEYFFDQPEKVAQFRWDNVKDEVFE